MRSAAGETGDTLSTIVVPGGDAHCPQRHGSFPPSRLMPGRPAFGVKPCMRSRLGPERQDNRARRLGPAAPCAAAGRRWSGMLVQPFDDASAASLVPGKGCYQIGFSLADAMD